MGQDPWDATRLVAHDLGFEVIPQTHYRRWTPPSSGGAPGRFPSWRTRARVSEADFATLKDENAWLTSTSRDYIEALARVGETLGVSGRILLCESSGVVLASREMSGEGGAGGAPGGGGAGGEPGAGGPAPGDILSLASSGANPVGLALETAAVVIAPPGGGEGEELGASVAGIAVPLGAEAVPVGCLAALVPNVPHPGVQPLSSQVLFSARAVSLALVLQTERSASRETAASLAHEVRNPLTAAKGFLELTLAQRQRVPKYAAVALRELDRAISLLEDYSLFTRAPGIVPNQRVKADGLLSEAALLARGLAAANPNLSITFLDSDPGLEILADVPRLKQVLLNLCRNAVEAMPNGGLLTLRAYREEGAGVLEVADTGVGIPDEVARRVFEPFFTTKSSGTGLGLPVCRRIVEAHGGRLTFESEPGRGTTFKVRLPIAPEPGGTPLRLA